MASCYKHIFVAIIYAKFVLISNIIGGVEGYDWIHAYATFYGGMSGAETMRKSFVYSCLKSYYVYCFFFKANYVMLLYMFMNILHPYVIHRHKISVS